ncbi:MAG: cobalamin-dependent protein, partial [Desulfosudaceae bacterium]
MPDSGGRPIKRLLLIFPPVYDVKVLDTMVCPPMGVASLAAYVRDLVEVAILDCVVEASHHKESVSGEVERAGLTDDEIMERIRSFGPDMVGLSCIFSNQIACVQELSRRIKNEIGPEVLVVTGGTHPSFLPEKTLTDTKVDVVVLGEGEIGLREIIQARDQGRDLASIDGIACRHGGEIIVRPRTSWIEDLDTLPFPARDLLPMEKYFQARSPMAYHWRKIRNTPIISSRGCPNRCAFCSSWRHWGKRFRKRSAENVLAEIKHLQEEFGIEELKWQDDNLTADKERAREIFTKMIERGLTMPWNTPNGIAIWTLDEDMLRLMKQSGCYEIALAVESGDPDSFQRFVGKPFSLEKAREIARLARKHRIATVGYFIIGFPGET